jgi:DNA-binding PucR family transcriptional regulator
VDVEWAAVSEPAEAQVWREVLRPVAADLRGQARELAARIVRQMQAQLPDVMPDAETVAENTVSAEETLRSLAQVIERGADPRAVELPASTIAFAHAGVHRQIPLTAVLRTYRIGHEQIWQWFFDHIVARTDDAQRRATATSLMSHWTFAFVDAAVTRAEQTYEVERERWLRSALASRGEAIAAILAGTERDTRRASQRLRYELARAHIGIAAAVEQADEDSDPQSLLSETISALAATVSADPLVFPSGVTTCMAWISRARRFSDDDIVALTRQRAPGVRVAIGEPGTGIDGFRHTQIDAGHARRVASEAKLSGPIRYADVAVVAMATADADQAARFVDRVLGPLAGDDEVTRRAAETLAVYLSENRSRTRAAARLYVHANTVSYRIRQAEEILGRSIESAPFDLQVALALLPAVRGARPTQ